MGYQSEQERITRAIADLRAQLKGGKALVRTGSVPAAADERPKRKTSAAARKRIAAARKKRWAEHHRKAGA